MTPREPTRCDRRPVPPAFSRIVPVLLTAAVLVLGAAALGAGEAASRGGAGRPVPSFLLPNLLALAMSLTVLVIACKRFRRE